MNKMFRYIIVLGLIAIVLTLAWTFLNRKGTETRLFSSSEFIQIAVADKSYGYSYSKDGKWHVNFKGKTIGPYIIRLARLGGYLNRTRDAPPGNMVLWRGMTRLTDIHLGFNLARIVGH